MERFSGNQRILLQAIRDLPKETDTGFVIDNELAENTGISLPQVQDLLVTLEATRFVDVARTQQGLKSAITAQGRIYLRDHFDDRPVPQRATSRTVSQSGQNYLMSATESNTNQPENRPALPTFDRIRLAPNLSPQPNANVKLKLFIEISNLSPLDLVVSSAAFTINETTALRFDPFMHRNVEGMTHYCEFLNDKRDAHSEFRAFLRPKQSITTFVGLDPSLDHEAISTALKEQRLGELEFNITWWDGSDRPSIYRLRKRL